MLQIGDILHVTPSFINYMDRWINKLVRLKIELCTYGEQHLEIRAYGLTNDFIHNIKEQGWKL